MSNLAFIVLLPNARRETVKVTQDTSILQVLEDICEKRGLNANEWNLKHFSRVIELGNSVRFSGLPNNATLEMVQSLKPRKESAINIVLQLESGKRLTHQFYPHETLWDVLEFWVSEGEKNVLPVDSSSIQPVCIYMRQDIQGKDKLEEKTLRSLGLFQGSAVIRLMHRTENQFRRQANVSTRTSSSSQSIPTNKMNSDPNKQMTRTNVNSKPAQKDKEKQNNGTVLPKQTIVNNPSSHGSKTNRTNQDSKAKKMTSHSRSDSKSKNSTEKNSQQFSSPPTNQTGETPSTVNEFTGPRQLHAQPGHLHMFPEFDAMLYHADDVNPPHIESPPDEFFEVTVQDVQSIYNDLQATRKQLEDAPLRTRSARNLEHDNAIQANLIKHPITIVRVRFPDRYCLQGTFKTNDTTRLLYSFVRGYLDNSQLNFYLFTTPPKKILPEDKTLIEEGLVGFVVVYVGSNDKPDKYVKETFCSKVSDPEQVFRYSPPAPGPIQPAYKAKKIEESPQNRQQKGESSKAGASSAQTQQQTRNSSQEPGPSSNRPTRSRPTNQKNSDAVLKWFSKGKKS